MAVKVSLTLDLLSSRLLPPGTPGSSARRFNASVFSKENALAFFHIKNCQI